MASDSSAPEHSRVMLNVLRDERRDEVVAVVVACVSAQRRRLVGLHACGLEHVGVQLVREERVGGTLVDEDAVGELRRILARDEFARVVLLPRVAVGARSSPVTYDSIR